MSTPFEIESTWESWGQTAGTKKVLYVCPTCGESECKDEGTGVPSHELLQCLQSMAARIKKLEEGKVDKPDEDE